jgi:WD repeat-containing protein 23
MGSNRGEAAGVLIGHTEGITHIDSKGDGRQLISNGKDQTCKLWDIRKSISSSLSTSSSHFKNLQKNRLDFDYRWQEYPARKPSRHPLDTSVSTFTGHSVLRTLIRCFFSPMFSTGARYVYSGSADGTVRIWDTLVSSQGDNNATNTSAGVGILKGDGLIRDLSWHPFDMYFVAGVWGEGGGGYSFRNQGGKIEFWEGGGSGGVGAVKAEEEQVEEEEEWTDEEEVDVEGF